MYKNRHSGVTRTQKNEGLWIGQGILYTSMHFVQINITVRTENLWLSNGSCHIVPPDAIKALFAWTVWERSRMIPRQDAASTPWCCCHMLVQLLLKTQCVTICVSERIIHWQCGQSRPFKSPWAAGESPKNWLHWSKWNKKHKQLNKNNTSHSTL